MPDLKEMTKRMLKLREGVRSRLDCALWRPATLKPAHQAGIWDAVRAGCLGCRERLATYLNAMVYAFVVGLLCSTGPSAVLRRVVAVVVDAFKCGASRTWPHVAKKCCEVIKPSDVHRNPELAVDVISRVEWITAALLSVYPRRELRGLAVAVASMAIAAKASAAFGIASPKHLSVHHFRAATVALAYPESAFLASFVGTANYDEFADAMACHVNGFGHA